MKEHPIFFSAPMVNAILDGRKTQTRRVVKHKGQLPPIWATFAQPMSNPRADGSWSPGNIFRWSEEQTPGQSLKPLRRWPSNGPDLVHDWYAIPCPYGQPGDRLWVKETWGYRCGCNIGHASQQAVIEYRADMVARALDTEDWKWLVDNIRQLAESPPKQEAPEQTRGVVAWMATDLDGHADVGFTQDIAKRRAGESCTYMYALCECRCTAPAAEPTITPDMIEAASQANKDNNATYAQIFLAMWNAPASTASDGADGKEKE